MRHYIEVIFTYLKDGERVEEEKTFYGANYFVANSHLLSYLGYLNQLGYKDIRFKITHSARIDF